MVRRSVRFTGLDALEKKLKQNVSLNQVKTVVKANTTELKAKMMRDAPVDTGFLKQSIIFELAQFGLTGKVRVRAEYAPYLIYGTRFMAKQDFMRPNFKAQSLQFKKDMDRLVK